MASTEYQRTYDAAHCTQVILKLYDTSDADIIAALKSSGNKQGYIKRLIREDIKRGTDEQPTG